ncbi:MAG: tetratricopeptide repeat protein [candidate division WOR-3 bacterium]
MKRISLLILFQSVFVLMLFAQNDLLKLAENQFHNKNYEDAKKSYQLLTKQFVNNEVAWFGLQNTYIKLGDLKTAQKAINIELSDRLLWGQIRILFYLKQFDTIPQMIFDLARKYPKSEYINDALDLGILLTSVKNDSNALKKYSDALFQYEMDNYDKAINIIKPLLIEPNIVAEYSYLLLAKLYVTKKEVNQAIATLNEFSVKFNKSRLLPKVKYEMGIIYFEILQDTIKAKDIWEDLISDFPESPQSFFARSRLAVLGRGQQPK